MTGNTYQQLLEFITDKRQMRMSHIYQPVMLMTLLQNQGKASTDQIAKEFLIRDQSQIEYYSQITNAMPGRVLGKNHGLVEKARGEYLLNGFDSLTPAQIDELVNVCQVRLDEYLEQRGQRIFNHRRKSAGYIPGCAPQKIMQPSA
jgi:ATP adenylyltransferase